MKFELFKSLDNLKWYVDIPESFGEPESKVEIYLIDGDPDKDEDLLNEDFIDSVDNYCGALLDLGDVDYFSGDKLIKLAEWLRNRLNQPCHERLRELYTVLLGYADRAIALGTGVVIEL